MIKRIPVGKADEFYMTVLPYADFPYTILAPAERLSTLLSPYMVNDSVICKIEKFAGRLFGTC